MLRRVRSALVEKASPLSERVRPAVPALALCGLCAALFLLLPELGSRASLWQALLLSLAPLTLLWQRRGAARRAEPAKEKSIESSEARGRQERERALGQFLQQLGRLYELPAIVSLVARQLSSDLPAGCVAIFLAERAEAGLKLLALAKEGKPLSIPPEPLPNQEIVDEAFAQSTSRLLSRPSAGRTQRVAHLAWPLRYRGRTLGVALFEELRLKSDGTEEIALAQQLLELVESPIGHALTEQELERQAQGWRSAFLETWGGLENALNDLADAAFLHAPDYTILQFNKAFQHRVGHAAHEIQGRKCYTVLFRRNEICPYCPYRAEEQAPAAHKAEVAQSADRGTLQILSVSRVDGEGKNQGAIEIVRDSTVEMRLHEQLLHSEKLASIGRLVSGVAHELNNPLTAISGHAQLLDRRAEDTRIKEKVKMILDEAGRASKIVRNLLTFARKQRSEQQVIDLNEVILKTLSLRDYELKTNQIQVILKLAPQLPSVVGDFHQLQQVLLNLISNAEHAMLDARGQGTLSIETFIEDKRVCLKVQDDGPGIPAEIRQRIFDPFFTTKPIGRGTGLGLSICFGILTEHKGTIAVESEVGQGATFHVSLPPAGERAEELVAGQPSQPFLLARKKVLVISMDTDVCDSLEDVLKPAGALLEICTGEEEGLAKCVSGGYDLVFAEWGGIGENRLADWLREGPSALAGHCILLTNKASLEAVQKFCEQTGASWLQKPVMFAELRIVVERVLRQLSLVTQRSP